MIPSGSKYSFRPALVSVYSYAIFGVFKTFFVEVHARSVRETFCWLV